VIIPAHKTIRMMRNANHEACWPAILKNARRIRTVTDDSGAVFDVYRISAKDLIRVMIRHRHPNTSPA